MNIYHDQLMDHYRNPRHKGTVTDADFVSRQFNPSCGDAVVFSGVIANKCLISVAFEGEGCVISQATASLVAEYVSKKLIDEIIILDAQWVQKLVGIPIGPTRLKCALLPLQALRDGLIDYQ